MSVKSAYLKAIKIVFTDQKSGYCPFAQYSENDVNINVINITREMLNKLYGCTKAMSLLGRVDNWDEYFSDPSKSNGIFSWLNDVATMRVHQGCLVT